MRGNTIKNLYLLIAICLIFSLTSAPRLLGQNLEEKLYTACEKGDLEAVKRIITAGGKINKTYGGYTPLYRASENGRLEVVKYLIANKARVNDVSNGKTALHIAASNGHYEIVKMLVASGANINVVQTYKMLNPFTLQEVTVTSDNTPLMNALNNGDRSDYAEKDKIALFLIQQGATYNGDADNFMLKCVKYGFENTFIYLLNTGMDKKLLLETKESLLRTVILSSKDERRSARSRMGKALIAKGAKYNTRDKKYSDGKTAIMLAK